MKEQRHPLIRAAGDAVEALGANGGGWNRAAREQTLAALQDSGLPDAHDEDWRFTPLQSLGHGEWVAAPRPEAGIAPAEYSVSGLEAVMIVLVDGFFDPELSDCAGFPSGLELLQGSENVPFPAGEYSRSRAFEGLNLAAAPDPFVLRVSGVIEQPVHLVHLSSAADESRLASPCFRVETGRGAELTLVEDHLSAEGSSDLVNLRVELDVGDNSHVAWTRLVRTAAGHRQLTRMRIRQSRDSVVRVQSMNLGGALVRHDVEVILDGPNSDCGLFGLVMGEGSQIVDNHSLIRHRASHSRSEEHFRNVLDGSSRAVFAGRVVVEEGTVGTDARQSNANLLLSDHARVDALPQLEIYNDDVKASHGSTLGQLDQDSMFYLRSRGIDAATARTILTWAFANVVVEEIGLDPVRALVRQKVFEHLPSAGLDEAVLGGLT
jgi:Fe-S cluster assembly protein SufD